MKAKIGTLCLIVASVIASFTALAHLSCIYFGPACYEAQLAPAVFIESANDGTWIAPAGAIGISALFLLCAAFALSRAGLICKLPLVKLATITIAIICVIRGLLTFQLKYRHPELVDTNNFIIGCVWFLTGILFWLGHRFVRNI